MSVKKIISISIEVENTNKNGIISTLCGSKINVNDFESISVSSLLFSNV
jgi:hypothetical protein